jgi:HD-like signal output (HDOD) protein
MQQETLDIIKRSASIPSMPMIATRCYEMTQDPDCDYSKVFSLLGKQLAKSLETAGAAA